MSRKHDLLKQFERALHEIDPSARVMVMEVLPGWNLDDKEKSEPVHFNPTQLQRVNDFLGPKYGVVETSETHLANLAQRSTSPGKLTLATIPVCPVCVVELDENQASSTCPKCGERLSSGAGEFGHAYDSSSITGVADALKAAAEPDHGNCGDWVRVSRFWLRRLADNLKGKP
ncbi:hypothetical protein LCGC14_0259510 [marine sediment metagenome]|uniref:Uncharacterized protein n=1 Tax=marine sediment metagenome TaxID=412755 RepID=A0A0F9WMZ2_9ZZZZ